MRKEIFHFHYRGSEIEYAIWFTSPDKPVERIVFLGTVQVGKIAEWVARESPEATAIIQGAPHWFAKDDGSDVRDFVHDFSENALDNILLTHEASLLRIIGDSQSAAFTLKIATNKKYFNLVDTVVLLQPLGFNIQPYDTSPSKRMKTFRRRFMKNAIYHLVHVPTDARLRHSHRQVYELVSADSKKADAQYAAGLAYDALDDLEQAHKMGLKVSIICGSLDKLFPPKEIRHNLQARGLPIEVIEVPRVPHSSLPTKQGLKLLHAAFELAR